jgi:hypothetical protein
MIGLEYVGIPKGAPKLGVNAGIVLKACDAVHKAIGDPACVQVHVQGLFQMHMSNRKQCVKRRSGLEDAKGIPRCVM